MGWCNGSYICEDVWRKIREYIPEGNRAQILGEIIRIFANEDADCWDKIFEDCIEYKEAMKVANLYDLYFDEEAS